MKYSKLHGNGVYARKALQKGEIVEFAPSVLLMNTEMLGTFELVSTGLVGVTLANQKLVSLISLDGLP